jgi:uncharacterized membrane protein YheB (UPF0754 family)
VDPNTLHEFGTGFFKYAFPLLFYTFHGWIATRLAIVMLFRPYEPVIIWGKQLPLTPGIFPKRRSKLASAVAGTITDTLLTTADIKQQAEHLVTEQNIYAAIDESVNAILTEFRDTTKLHRLAHDLSELTPVFLEQLVNSIVDSVESGRDRNIVAIAETTFDQIVLTVRLSRSQADEAASWIMDSIVTPANVRNELIKMLTPQNITALDESIQQHAGGPYKLLARLIGVKRVCYEWRNFLEKEPDQAQKIIADTLKDFNIEEQISNRIANFDLRSFPVQTISQIKQQVVSLVEEFLVSHRDDMLSFVKYIQGPAQHNVQSAIIRFNPERIQPDWLLRTKQNLATFCYSYLKKELGGLLERAIPALGVYGMIARKIDLFSPQQLESVIYRICKQELGALELFGAIIGFWLGCLQVVINIFYYH